MNTDEQVLREGLRGAIGRFEAGPAPVNAVMRRGRAIRSRRRTIAASGTAALAAVLAVAVWAQTAGAPGTPGPVVASGPGVTLNEPDPQAPGGVFASGTADGTPWQLAVRNIAGPGPWCLPAVMLNGHNGDVLFGADSGAPAISKPAFLTDIPGRPGIGVAFVQVLPYVTKIVADLPGGGSVSQRPVTLTLCGQRFHLAGFAFGHAQRGVTRISAYSQLGLEESLYMPPGTFTHSPLPSTTFSAGVWDNTTTSATDIQRSSAAPISSGRIGGVSWTIKTGLGLWGQCYTGFTVAATGSGAAGECLPVEAPPRGITLARVPFPASTAVPITGYAGLVSPRAAYLIANLSDGTTRRLVPVEISVRHYFGLAIGHGTTLAGLTAYDAAGRTVGAAISVPAVK